MSIGFVVFRRVVGYLLFGAAVSASTPAAAALFIVDSNLNDLADIAPGNGLCEYATFVPVGQRCTLRAAITEANALPGTDTIIIPDGWVIVMVQNIRGEDAGLSGDYDITDSLVLGSFATGAARPVIDSNGLDRVFDLPLNNQVVNLRLANLVISGGAANQSNGFAGGGLHVFVGGTVEIFNTEISGNTANAGGGAWITANVIDIDQVEFRNNTATNVGFTNADAAGLRARGLTSLTIRRSTIANNGVLGAASPHRFGSWIESSSGVKLVNTTISNNLPSNLYISDSNFSLNNVTISGSSLSQNGLRVFWALGGSSAINNSIIDGHVSTNCAFSIVSGVLATNHNHTLSSDSTCELGFGANNISGQPAQLLPLGFNGGPTRTHNLASGSPALEAGATNSVGFGACETTDQRGSPRPSSIGTGVPRCDMGAVEANQANDLLLRDGFEDPV